MTLYDWWVDQESEGFWERMFLWDGNEEEQAILKKYTVCCSSVVVVFKAIREGDL